MEIKDRWVMIPNAFGGKVKDEEGEDFLPNISNEAVALYYMLVAGAGLKSTAITNLGYLLGDFKFTVIKEQMQAYRDALQELQELGYIELYNEELESIGDTSKLKSNTAFRYSITELEGNYFRADINDVETLIDYMSDNKMRARASFIRYYMVLQRKTNYTRMGTKNVVGNEIGQITGAEAQELIGITPKTFTEYNRILSELGIYNFSNKYVTPKTFKNVPTRFARTKFMSKSRFECLVDKEMQGRGYKLTNKEVTREKIRRSMIKHHAKGKQELKEQAGEQVMIEVEGQVEVCSNPVTKRIEYTGADDDFEF